MRAINTYLVITIILAIAMTAAHYAVASAIGRFTREAAPLLIACERIPAPVEIVKLDTGAVERWIEEARRVAVRVANENGTVTVDDIWNECSAPPEGMDGRKMMAAFPRSEWEVVGSTQSTRNDVNHGRRIAVWSRKTTERVAA